MDTFYHCPKCFSSDTLTEDEDSICGSCEHIDKTKEFLLITKKQGEEMSEQNNPFAQAEEIEVPINEDGSEGSNKEPGFESGGVVSGESEPIREGIQQDNQTGSREDEQVGLAAPLLSNESGTVSAPDGSIQPEEESAEVFTDNNAFPQEDLSLREEEPICPVPDLDNLDDKLIDAEVDLIAGRQGKTYLGRNGSGKRLYASL